MTPRRSALAGLREHLRPLRVDTPTSGTLTGRGYLSTTGLAAQGALRFATSWVVGRIAGKAVLGTVQAAISTASLFALLWPTTTGSAASKYLALARGAGDTEQLSAVTRHFQRRAVQSTLLISVAVVPFWVYYDHGRWVDGLYVALFTAAYSGYSFIRGVHFGTGQAARAATWDVLSAVAGFLALVALLLAGVRGPALLTALAASYLVYTVAGWPRGVDAGAALDRALRREMDHMVLLGVLGTLASAGFLQISMIVARATDPVEAGQFAAAMATATPASLLATSLSLVLFPSLAEAWGRRDHVAFATQTDRATRVLVVVMVGIFGSLVICSRLVMSVLWGPKFDAESLILPLLLVGLMFTNTAVASVNALVTRSHRAMVVTSGASFAGLVTGALTWVLLTPTLGVEGVAVGFLVGSAVAGALPLLVEWRRGRHHWGGLALRAATGVVAFVALTALVRGAGTPLVLEPVAALVFVALWLLLSRRDLAYLPIPPALRRRLRLAR